MASTQKTSPSASIPHKDAGYSEPGNSNNANGAPNGTESTSRTTENSEPFPNLETAPQFQYSASLLSLNTTPPHPNPTLESPQQATPVSPSLRIQTEHLVQSTRRENLGDQVDTGDQSGQEIVYNAGLPVRQSSIRSVQKTRPHRKDSLSPGSAVSSPGIGPLVDMTPLPSPISAWGSPNLWRSSMDSEREESLQDASIVEELTGDAPQFTPFNRIPSKKRKIPVVSRGVEAPIYDAKAAAHARQRSLSDYVPEGMQIPKTRNIVVSTSAAIPDGALISPPDEQMHREEYLAVQRGITVPIPPTPPDSNIGADSGSLESQASDVKPAKVEISPIYEARTIRKGQLSKWRALRQLGKGTFSTVMLATSQRVQDEDSTFRSQEEFLFDPALLVAVKICEQGPAGGADEKKIEVSIKRELELMKAIDHPSLVHLKAVNMLDRQTIIVENYCAGGDLFELASLKLDYLTPFLIRRIFSELVAAVRYLHLQYIVHRDIKLENILVNITTPQIPTVTDWQTYPSPVVTLTDLGLGRWIPKPPESPMLDTRCGSEDYAAPEVLLGQEYDGRSTDAWALGVVLYAIMEGRLPFDPVPGSRRRSPTSHKIARCEWQWVRWADADGEWDATKGSDLNEAREVVEGLIAKRRSRWELEKVEQMGWVKGGINVPGGLQRPYNDGDD